MVYPTPLFLILLVYTIQSITFGTDDITLPLGIATETDQLQTHHHRQGQYSPHRKMFEEIKRNHPDKTNENHSKLLPLNP
jgi:hypothetical protein